MNIFLMILFGISGFVIGNKIPDISLQIIIYKKKELTIKNQILYSKCFRLGLGLLNAGIWILATRNMSNILPGIILSLLVTIGIIIAFIDINIRIIPNELILAVSFLGLMFQVLLFGARVLPLCILTMFVLMFVFISIAGFVGLGKVGAGDVKLSGAMGLALGYPLIIISVFIMAIVLFVFIIIGFILKKLYLSSMLPLAPFMMCGFVAALISVVV